jgi:hypothetical protein
LLIPIQGNDGKVWSAEAINVDGTKDYLEGGRKHGCFYQMGDVLGSNQILIGEGVATVAAAVSATGLPGIAYLDIIRPSWILLLSNGRSTRERKQLTRSSARNRSGFKKVCSIFTLLWRFPRG